MGVEVDDENLLARLAELLRQRERHGGFPLTGQCAGHGERAQLAFGVAREDVRCHRVDLLLRELARPTLVNLDVEGVGRLTELGARLVGAHRRGRDLGSFLHERFAGELCRAIDRFGRDSRRFDLRGLRSRQLLRGDARRVFLRLIDDGASVSCVGCGAGSAAGAGSDVSAPARLAGRFVARLSEVASGVMSKGSGFMLRRLVVSVDVRLTRPDVVGFQQSRGSKPSPCTCDAKTPSPLVFGWISPPDEDFTGRNRRGFLEEIRRYSLVASRFRRVRRSPTAMVTKMPPSTSSVTGRLFITEAIITLCLSGSGGQSAAELPLPTRVFQTGTGPSPILSCRG